MRFPPGRLLPHFSTAFPNENQEKPRGYPEESTALTKAFALERKRKNGCRFSFQRTASRLYPLLLPMGIALTRRTRRGILHFQPRGSRGHCLGLPSALAAGDALSLRRTDQVFFPFFANTIICSSPEKVKPGRRGRRYSERAFLLKKKGPLALSQRKLITGFFMVKNNCFPSGTQETVSS